MSSSRKITFVIQNETHAYNFDPIISVLLSKGVPKELIKCITLDSVTGLSCSKLIKNDVVVTDLNIAPVFNFYFAKWVSRIVWLLKHHRHLRQLVADTKILIMGNDGAIQRVFINRVKIGSTILLLDGLLIPWPKLPSFETFSCYLKKAVFRLASMFKLNWLAPSHVGHSKLDVIYVMDEFVKKVLQDQIETKVEVVTLPRISTLISQKETEKGAGDTILYVTSAFFWHGDRNLAQKQWEDLKDFNLYALDNSECKFRIRVHPREPRDQYLNFKFAENITLSFCETSVAEDLFRSCIVVTAVSTMAYEAKQIGIPVIIYTKNICLGDRTIFHHDPYYTKTDDLSVINEVRISNKINEVRSHTANGVDVVADKILSLYGDYD